MRDNNRLDVPLTYSSRFSTFSKRKLRSAFNNNDARAEMRGGKRKEPVLARARQDRCLQYLRKNPTGSRFHQGEAGADAAGHCFSTHFLSPSPSRRQCAARAP